MALVPRRWVRSSDGWDFRSGSWVREASGLAQNRDSNERSTVRPLPGDSTSSAVDPEARPSTPEDNPAESPPLAGGVIEGGEIPGMGPLPAPQVIAPPGAVVIGAVRTRGPWPRHGSSVCCLAPTRVFSLWTGRGGCARRGSALRPQNLESRPAVTKPEGSRENDSGTTAAQPPGYFLAHNGGGDLNLRIPAARKPPFRDSHPGLRPRL